MLSPLLFPLFLLAQSDETARLLADSVRLSPAAAAKIEATLASKPDDLNRHITLLGYYEAAERSGNEAGAEDARLRHLEWFVTHKATSDALRSDAALAHAVESTSPSYQKLRDLWLAELKRNPESVDIHINAAQFLALLDRQTARTVLQDAAQLDPKNHDISFLLGVLDGLTVIDINAIDHDGLPNAAGIPQHPSQEAIAGLRSLEESGDARRVCGSATAIVRYGSTLLGTPYPSRDVLKIAASLLNRALKLDPKSRECLEYGARVNAWLTMRNSGWLAQQSQRVVVDGAVAQRWKATDVAPVYPAQARTHGLQGTVTIIAVIGSDGRIKKAEAVSGPDALRPAALASFQHWTYKPPTRSGSPVEYLTDVQFHFTLSR